MVSSLLKKGDEQLFDYLKKSSRWGYIEGKHNIKPKANSGPMQKVIALSNA
jgi:hypothetical protein